MGHIIHNPIWKDDAEHYTTSSFTFDDVFDWFLVNPDVVLQKIKLLELSCYEIHSSMVEVCFDTSDAIHAHMRLADVSFKVTLNLV